VEREIRIFADGAAIARRAAQEFVQTAASAVHAKGSFNVALAGGSTPKALYNLLVNDPALRSQVPWDKIHLFFGDERHVAPDHPDSNYRMASEAMISKSPLKPEQVTRIKGEYPDADQSALEYEKALREYFKLKAGEYPRFDLVLAGMGNEGPHAVAFSLEPKPYMQMGASRYEIGSASCTPTASTITAAGS